MLCCFRFICGNYSQLPRIQSITGLMLFSLIIPIAVLSLFPHQEARFIIPVLLPLVYLYGNLLFANEDDKPSIGKLKRMLRVSWLTTNLVLTIFFGFVHQGGIYPFANKLHREIKSVYGVQTHVITTHSYSIPTFLLQLESTSQLWRDRKTGQTYKLAPTTFLHKYGSLPMADLFTKVDDELSRAEELLHNRKKQYRFYIASPCSLERKFRAAASKYTYFDLIEEYSFYPHFCTEALPTFPSNRDQLCVENNALRKNESLIINLNILQRISCFLKRFCLRVYSVKVKDLSTK